MTYNTGIEVHTIKRYAFPALLSTALRQDRAERLWGKCVGMTIRNEYPSRHAAEQLQRTGRKRPQRRGRNGKDDEPAPPSFLRQLWSVPRCDRYPLSSVRLCPGFGLDIPSPDEGLCNLWCDQSNRRGVLHWLWRELASRKQAAPGLAITQSPNPPASHTGVQ